jgi:hypothetical protein
LRQRRGSDVRKDFSAFATLSISLINRTSVFTFVHVVHGSPFQVLEPRAMGLNPGADLVYSICQLAIQKFHSVLEALCAPTLNIDCPRSRASIIVDARS